MKNNPPIELQHEFWQTAYEWLKQTGNALNKNYCREEITTHPDYPSLISLTDFLDSGNMSYNAVKSDSSYIHEYNYPILIHIKQPGTQYMYILKDAAGWDKQKEITQHWTGVILYPGKNAKWQNDQHRIYQNSEKRRAALPVTFFVIALLLFLITTSRFDNYIIDNHTDYQVIRTGIFGLFSIAGIVISIAAMGTELGLHNEITRQVCGATGKGGCEQVLTSRFAKGIAGITPADGAVIYFTSQFILYLLSPLNTAYLSCIFLISFGGMALVGWSIYMQVIKLKQWCALCLAIATILTLQCVISLTAQPSFPGLLPGIHFASIFVFLALVTLPVKQLLKTNKANKLKLAELKKWKSDADLFVAAWDKEPGSDTTVWKNDLLLGNPEAPLMITVACNPYCNPCAKAHTGLDRLLERFPEEVNILIRLSSNPKDETDRKTIAVKAILQKSRSLKNKKEIRQMLTDWFEMMNYEKWEKKWPSAKSIVLKNREEIDIQNRVKEHNDWMDQSKIAFTPTFFINGKKLPGRYSIHDMEGLIPELTALLSTEMMEVTQ